MARLCGTCKTQLTEINSNRYEEFYGGRCRACSAEYRKVHRRAKKSDGGYQTTSAKKCAICKKDLTPDTACKSVVNQGGRCRSCNTDYSKNRSLMYKQAVDPTIGPFKILIPRPIYVEFLTKVVLKFGDLDPHQVVLDLIQSYE
jgi:hypothetical protein